MAKKKQTIEKSAEIKEYRASEVLKAVFEAFKVMGKMAQFEKMPEQKLLKRKFLKQIIISAMRGAMEGAMPLLRGNMVNAGGTQGLQNPMVPVWGGLFFLTDFLADRLWEMEDKSRQHFEEQIRKNFTEYANMMFMDAAPAFRLYTPLPSFNQASGTAANAMTRFADSVMRLASTGARGITAGAVLFGISKPLLAAMIAWGAINVAWSVAHQKKMQSRWKDHRKEMRESHQRIGDIASNVSIIQRTSNQNRYKGIISGELGTNHDKYLKLNVKDWGFYIKRNTVLSVVNTAAAAATYFVARATNKPIGTFLTSIDNVGQINNATSNLAGIISTINKSISEYNEAFEILNSRTIIEDKPGAVPLDIADLRKNPPVIEFKNITFQYPKKKKSKDGGDKDDGDGLEPKKVLDNFNLTLRGGEKVAIMGESGVGKTTMLSLLLREYEQQSGEIWIDGHKNDDITLDTLRRAVRYIPQADGFLNRTVRENLLLVKPDATDKEISLALARAKILETVEEKGGLDTEMGFGGNAFSGGQKHRIALARAFLGNAPVMIFDEPTSDLDQNTKKMVVESIRDFAEGKTTVIITHDPTVAEQFDRVIFMQDGKITDDGRPEDLLGNPNGAFYKSKSEHIGKFAKIAIER